MLAAAFGRYLPEAATEEGEESANIDPELVGRCCIVPAEIEGIPENTFRLPGFHAEGEMLGKSGGISRGGEGFARQHAGGGMMTVTGT